MRRSPWVADVAILPSLYEGVPPGCKSLEANLKLENATAGGL